MPQFPLRSHYRPPLALDPSMQRDEGRLGGVIICGRGTSGGDRRKLAHSHSPADPHASLDLHEHLGVEPAGVLSAGMPERTASRAARPLSRAGGEFVLQLLTVDWAIEAI